MMMVIVIVIVITITSAIISTIWRRVIIVVGMIALHIQYVASLLGEDADGITVKPFTQEIIQSHY